MSFGKLRDHDNWMSCIDDQKNISTLTIPGTHDSHATVDNVRQWYMPNATIATQVVDIKSQLQLGVRYLDLRVGPDNFNMRHGAAKLDGVIDDVCNVIEDFLKGHNKEVVLVSIKWDDDSTPEPDDMKRKIWELWDNHKWYREVTWPTLGQARGKAVLLRRFGAPAKGSTYYPLGINFTGFWGTEHFEEDGVKWDQQDDGMFNLKGWKWGEGLNEVWRRCWNHLDYTRNDSINSGIVHFTGLAIWSLWDGPLANADEMNPRLMRWLGELHNQTDPDAHRYGVIILDKMQLPEVTKIVVKNWKSKVFTTDKGLYVAGGDDPFVTFPNGVNMIFQRDGNLVVRDGNKNVVWASNTAGKGAKALQFSVDGGLSITDGKSQIWKTGPAWEANAKVIFMDHRPYIMVDTHAGKGEILWTIDS